MNHEQIRRLRETNPQVADAIEKAELDLDFAGWLDFEGAKSGASQWYNIAARTLKLALRRMNKAQPESKKSQEA